MAFFSRVGNLLKQTVTKHVSVELSAVNPSLFQAVRSMSSSPKLFVGGLSYSTDEMSLREAFSQYGEVVEARVILDRDTGRSRGFAFVSYASTDAASSAIQAFDGQELHGRRIRVNFATEKPRGDSFGGGFGGQGGGFGYGGQGGNYGGGGGYQGGNYSGGGGGYGGGSGNQYSGGGGFGGGGYGSGDAIQSDGNCGGGNVSGSQEARDGFSTGNDDFAQMDGNDRDDEPNDYANTRG